MDLILNQIMIVLNTFLIAVIPVGMGNGNFKCKVLCLLHMHTAQLIFKSICGMLSKAL